MRNSLIAGLMAPLLLFAACNLQTSAQTEAARTHAAEARAEQDRAAAARTRTAIEGVLAADARTGSIDDYASRLAAMRAIDLTQCPSDFSTAYLDHIFAWERAERIQQSIVALNSDDSRAAALAGSFLTGLLRLEGTPLLDHLREDARLNALAADAHEQIRVTFEKVERSATAYGARLQAAS